MRYYKHKTLHQLLKVPRPTAHRMVKTKQWYVCSDVTYYFTHPKSFNGRNHDSVTLHRHEDLRDLEEDVIGWFYTFNIDHNVWESIENEEFDRLMAEYQKEWDV